MPYGFANEITGTYFEETTFAAPPGSWSASGTNFLCVAPDWSSVSEQTVENMNYRQRAYSTRQKVRGLRSGSQLKFGVYHTGRGGSVVAEGANITTFFVADFLRNAWGGRRLGRRSGVAAGTAAIPTVDAGQGASWEAGDFFAFVDTSDSSRVFFSVVESISTDTVTLQFTLPVTPDATGLDSTAACITCFIDSDAIKDRADANYITHSFLFTGDLGDDQIQCNGVKLQLDAIEGTEPGGEPLFRFSGMVTTFDDSATGITPPSALPVGDAPLVAATGANTFVRIGTAGVPPTVMTTYDAANVKINPGVSRAATMVLGGTEGVAGYHGGGYDDTTIEMDIDFDDAWILGYEAGTRYKILIQIGTTAGTAIAYYACNAEIMEKPSRGDNDNVAVSKLKFRCLENANTTAAVGDALEKFRSKLIVGFTAPIV
jgi:hypothetical protein